MQFVFATSNPHKVEEVREILKGLDVDILSLKDLNLKVDKEESATTFEGNARIKAEDIASKTSIPVIADDSGLSIVALNNFPGVHSARFMEGEPYEKKNRAILEMMKDKTDRRAFFTCAVIFIDKNRSINKAFIGVADGEIIKEYDEGAKSGFGYDPIFYSYDLKKTFGRAEEEEKNSVSHRGKAFKQLIEFLSKEYSR